MQRLLVTGGSGYLGSHLARLAASEASVVATYRSRPVQLPGCRSVFLDICDRAAVLGLVSVLKPAAIVHTAYAQQPPAAMHATIMEGSCHIAHAAARSGAHLVHLSSDMVFDGDHAPYSEDDPPAPITAYGRAKAAAEKAVLRVCPGAAVVRTSLISGFSPPDPRTAWVLESLTGGTPITLFSDEIRCPVWVEQLAAALLELARSRAGGIWHLAGPQAISRYELGRRLARAYGLPETGLTAGLSRQSVLLRPRDLTLLTAKASSTLHSPLWGIDEVLAHVAGAPL